MKRRKFLQSIPYAVAPAMLGGLPIKAFGSTPLLEALLAPYVDTDHVLVLIQLQGGNDGLNMVIPLDQYTGLTAVRSNIYIPENKVLKLSGAPATGLHPAMTGMQQLHEEGKLAILQSVGYPNPNFSHARATDIWLSGSDSNKVVNSGWVGRYMGYEYPNYPAGYPNTTMPDPLAIQIGSSVSPVFQSLGLTTGMAVPNEVIVNGNSVLFNLSAGAPDPAPLTPAGKELAYLREVVQQNNSFNAVVEKAWKKVTTQGTYPANNALAAQLKAVARLIAGGLKTRVYMVTSGGIGSFDNHSNQVDTNDHTIGTHATLLTRVSAAIRAFMDDLAMQKVQDRVIGMTFSEFGRRIKSNASLGTDHGAAAPMFVFGNAVNKGVLGTNPVISPSATAADNIPYQYDFRSVYASILKDWFCVPKDDLDTILLKDFQTLPLIKAGTNCISTDIHELNQKAGENLISNYPNPFTDITTVKFESQGGHAMVQILDTQGREIRMLANGDYDKGQYEIRCDLEGLPSGTYYVRLQNEMLQQVKAMVKVR